jgi:photosystem II stability/assembly factor-like uncharacterized protein
MLGKKRLTVHRLNPIYSDNRGRHFAFKMRGGSREMRTIMMALIASLALAGSGQAGWVQQMSGVGMNLRAVSFADSLVGLAGGYGGGTGDTLLRTTDGGTTWQVVRTGYPNSTLAIDMVTSLIAWATGSTLTVKTTNGGLSWVQQFGPNGNGISFSDPMRGLCVGPSGYVWRTTNGGSLWVEESSGVTWDLFDVCMVDSNHAWACGYDDTMPILASRDGGQTWTRQRIPNVSVNYLTGISFSDTLHGLTLGFDYIVFRTTNGGMVWNDINSGISKTKNKVVLVDSLWGWMDGCFLVSEGALIARTTDGGLTWTAQSPGTTQRLFGMSFTDRRNGWAVGDNGTIVHTSDGGVWVEEEGQRDKRTRKQGDRAKPNPFTSYAVILGHEEEQVVLYDISGKLMGMYRGDRIGADLPSGIYFVRLQDQESKPLRIVKLK